LEAAPVAEAGQLKFFDEFIEASPAQGGWKATFLQGQQQIVSNTKAAKDTGFLGQIADALAGPLGHGQGPYRTTIKQHITAVRPQKASDQVESGGFASPIGAQQAHYFARLQLQTHPLNNRAAPKS
jgi:hypothetical protein